jgi:hypothetical protein
VKTRYYQQSVPVYRVKEHVGKTPQERTTSTFEDSRELKRVPPYALHRTADFGSETEA